MVVEGLLSVSLSDPSSEAWFPLGCLLLPLFALSRRQANACVQDSYASQEGWLDARCLQAGHLQALLCPCSPEHTAGGTYTVTGSLRRIPEVRWPYHLSE